MRFGGLRRFLMKMVISGAVWRPPAGFCHQNGHFWFGLAASPSTIPGLSVFRHVPTCRTFVSPQPLHGVVAGYRHQPRCPPRVEGMHAPACTGMRQHAPACTGMHRHAPACTAGVPCTQGSKAATSRVELTSRIFPYRAQKANSELCT